jgi:hypothetical protein
LAISSKLGLGTDGSVDHLPAAVIGSRRRLHGLQLAALAWHELKVTHDLIRFATKLALALLRVTGSKGAAGSDEEGYVHIKDILPKVSATTRSDLANTLLVAIEHLMVLWSSCWREQGTG